MCAENVAMVRRICDGWSSGELAETPSFIDAGLEVHPDPESAWPASEPPYRGQVRGGKPVRLDVNWGRERAFAELAVRAG
jgi:hypothetical protein